jgi:hypothetical protein
MARRKAAAGTVRVNFKDVESRKTPAEGDYIVEVLEATSEKGPSGDMIKFTLEVAKGEFKGSKLWFYCPLAENSLWKLHGFLEALGEDVPSDEMDLDLSELVGKQCVGILTHETYKGRKQAKMTDFDSVDNYSGKDGDDDKKSKKDKKGKKDKDSGKEEKSEKGSKKDKEKKSDKKDDAKSDKKSDDKKGKDGKKDKKEKVKAIYDSSDIEDLDEKKLQKIIDKHDLDVDLDDFKKLPKKVSAVTDALEAAGLLKD